MADAEATAVRQSLAAELRAAGVRPGGVLLVHSSLSSLGQVAGGAETVIDALLEAVGPEGTLCVPALSYLFTTLENPEFVLSETPSNLGAIPEAFRHRPEVLRSLHPTHSVCAAGAQAAAIVGRHGEDRSPVGPHSPFRRVRELCGQVAFLGCSPRCNTSIHGVEELLPQAPPYLFLETPVSYSVTDAEGSTSVGEYRRHKFGDVGQRYERLVELLPPGAYLRGDVGQATLHLMDAEAMWATAEAALLADPLCMVESIPAGSEGHLLKRSAGGACRYEVGPAA